MSPKLIVGNWKMNGSLAANAALIAGVQGGLRAPACDVVICPPAPYLAQAAALCAGTAIQLGAQDVSPVTAGARTGEVAAEMLLEFDVRWCIVGHSERRTYHREDNGAVARKAQRLIQAGITPIVCVGETADQRAAGLTEETVTAQLDAVITLNHAHLDRLVVAYEPVWAIGTGETATPTEAARVHALLRQCLQTAGAQQAAAVRILYGGSMKAGNAAALLAEREIDGGLIGGAALRAAEFLQIIAAAVPRGAA